MSAQDTNPQLYHSDAGGDIVSLMAVRLPSSSSSSSSSGEHGGASTVGSAAAVYNALAKRRPDILRILAEHKFRWEAYVYLFPLFSFFFSLPLSLYFSSFDLIKQKGLRTPD